MKVRKLAVALALAGGLGSGMAQALGLGEIEMQSWLNQPLDAEISLRQSRGVDPGDVFVNVAPEAAYQRVGLERHQFLSKLKFEVVTEADGNLAINVSSREPFREPYLNFLLELTWPSGRLMREYAVLVDPPVYAEESGVREQVAVPSSAPQRSSTPRTSRSEESIRRQSAVQNARSSGSRASGYSTESFGPTGPSDTLWTIAQRMRPNNSVSMQQVMLAIQDKNPNAFIGDNINRLKRGQVLRAPTLAEIEQRSKAEASRVVARQNQALKTPRPVDATQSSEKAAQPIAKPQEAEAGAELRLIAADETEARSEEQGGSAGGDGTASAGGVDAGSAAALEELEATRRQNEELNSRLEDMQSQVETLQRLLELKSTQLADLQGAVSEDVVATPDGGQGSENGVSADAGDEAPSDGMASPDESVGEGSDIQADVAVADAEAVDGQLAEGVEGLASAEEEGTPTTDDGALEGSPEASLESVGSEGEAAGTAVDQAEEAGGGASDDAAKPIASGSDASAQVQPNAENQPAEESKKGLLGQLMDAVVGNPMYQLALGGGLILLLLLLLLVARRNANREKAFYDQLNADDESDSEGFDLALANEPDQMAVAAESDSLAEADSYIAYGQHDKAAQILETAISREPSRTDLRLKLLETYADGQDYQSFDKQFGEVEALGDDEALARAVVLKQQLEEAEAMPSIDDLENELRSDSLAGFASEAYDNENEPEVSATPVEDEFQSLQRGTGGIDFGEELDSAENREGSPDDAIEYDLSGIVALDKSDESERASAEESEFSSFEMDVEADSQVKKPDDVLGENEFSLDFELSEEDEAVLGSGGSEDALDTEMDLTETLDLDGELDDLGALPVEETEKNVDQESALDELSGEESALDESFLDELDAELEKVEEDGQADALDLNESGLEDLELDVSDEDLALMDEFSDLDKAGASDEGDGSLDEELGLEDALDDLEQGESPVVEDAADIPSLESEVDVEEGEGKGLSGLNVDDADLADDDDFDFLAGTDEAATKLDLARAYVEMGDGDGARDILEEVALEGNEEQKAEAQELLKNLS
ncbi:FimV/HubP family polar landmark protein [Marinobacter sp.]|uniref:FimV/HubP family polar landmark protein n=1 Tax=Marinobacter sp. TaxID=50741 RepID=UPI002B268A3B|nr:FimV/HubP family polar landmark protein [Marinobacter sp.]